MLAVNADATMRRVQAEAIERLSQDGRSFWSALEITTMIIIMHGLRTCSEVEFVLWEKRRLKVKGSSNLGNFRSAPPHSQPQPYKQWRRHRFLGPRHSIGMFCAQHSHPHPHPSSIRCYLRRSMTISADTSLIGTATMAPGPLLACGLETPARLSAYCPRQPARRRW